MPAKCCPHCDAELPTEAINIAEGAALCGSCGELSRLSEVLDASESREEFDRWIEGPPKGCSIQSFGNEFVLVASLRSFGSFLAALGVCLFWNGIVSVFVAVAIAGLWSNFVGKPPEWLPAPEMNDKPMSLGMTLFLCLFLTPFLVIGMGMLMAVFTTAFGRVRVNIKSREAAVRTGFGIFNWRQRFDPREVQRVSAGLSTWTKNEEKQPQIHIDADKTVKFGSMLRDERREWLKVMLTELLVRKNAGRITELLAAGRKRR